MIAADIRGDLWTALASASSPASVPELAASIGADADQINWRLSRWAGLGFVEAIKPASADGRTTYLMAAAARAMAAPPALDADRQPSRARGGRTSMWRSIRVLKRFDLVELSITAEVTEPSAKQFVSCLLRAGILRRERRGHALTGQRSIYALAGQFGPRTPIVRQRREDGRRIQEVVDPNTGAVREISSRQRSVGPLF